MTLFLALAGLVLVVTGGLAWLTAHWTRLARKPAAGMGLYSRAMAGAATTALVIWGLGVTVAGLGYWLLPPLPSHQGPAASPPGASSPSPEAPGTPATPTVPDTSPATPAVGSSPDAFEFTEQPELPTAIAEAMAEAEAAGTATPATGSGALVVLATGDVVISGVDPESGKVTAWNRSDYAVSLDGWSLAAYGPEAEVGAGQPQWLDLPDGLVLGPGERLEVVGIAQGYRYLLYDSCGGVHEVTE